MIAAMNVIRGIPPQQLPPGMKVDISPILEHMAGAAFGPRMAPKVLINQQHQMDVPPELENQLLLNSFPANVHPQDNDVQHIQVHQSVLQQDMHGFVKQHIMEHMMQLKQKNAPPPPPQGAPGVPGGAGPGVAGTPRMGAQPGIPRPQQPPGAVSQDHMPLAMPRKAGV